jgi:hypothetical protein
MTLQAVSGARCGCLSRVVRLDRAEGDDRVGSMSQSLADEKLELACLVASSREASAVVSL